MLQPDSMEVFPSPSRGKPVNGAGPATTTPPHSPGRVDASSSPGGPSSATLTELDAILTRSKSREEYTMSGDSRPRFKRINDCIHGTIELPPAAVAIIDTPQFQRLRYIKQTGLCHLVFPNATHNRFQHSIGVGFLGQKFALRLQKENSNLVSDKDVLCVMLAGLCHDLGHGPLSHLWEFFMREAQPEQEYHHEDMSIQMLDWMLENNNLKPRLKKLADLDEADIIFVKEMIAGPLDPETGLPDEKADPNASTWPYRGRPESKSFLYEIIANKINGIDVDKWDYFLRDDYYLKIGHVFNYERFMSFCRIEETGSPKRRRLCLRDKEAQNLLDMFDDRARLHKNGYQHRVTKIADRMLVDAWLLADQHVQKLRDEFVEYLIMESDNPALQPAREIIERIHCRDFYHIVDVIDVHKHRKQLNDLSDQQILAELQLQIQSSSNLNDLQMGDFSIIRTKVTPGFDSEAKFCFYNSERNTDKLEQTKAQNITDYIPLRNRPELLYICCKRAAVADQAASVVSDWRGIKGILFEKS